MGTISNPHVSDSEIQKEKGVIEEEILRNKADPSRAIWDYAWLPLFFRGTDLARPYSGASDDVSRIYKSDVERFLAKYFQAENVVIFVAGDFKPSFIQKVVDKYSKDYKSNYKKEEIIPLVPKRGEQVFVHIDPSYYQTSLSVGIKTVPFTSPLKYRFDILKEMLAGYFSAPLIQKLRNEGVLIYTWVSFHDNISDMGYLFLNVTVAHENVDQVASIILQEFKRIAEGKFSDDEIKMARSHLIGSILANTETGQDYIKWYGLQELLSPKHVLSVEDKVSLYKKITNSEIRDLTKSFAKDNVFIAVIGKADKASLSKLI